MTRLAMVYATLDAKTTIELPHMEAALALWAYCRQSLAFALGTDPLSADALRILNAIRSEPTCRLSRLDVRRGILQGHRDAAAIDLALTELTNARLVWLDMVVDTGGRNRQDIVLRSEPRDAQSAESTGGDADPAHEHCAPAQKAQEAGQHEPRAAGVQCAESAEAAWSDDSGGEAHPWVDVANQQPAEVV